jgi:hypothetical protein
VGPAVMSVVLAIWAAPFVLAWIASCAVAVMIMIVAIKSRFTR